MSLPGSLPIHKAQTVSECLSLCAADGKDVAFTVVRGSGKCVCANYASDLSQMSGLLERSSLVQGCEAVWTPPVGAPAGTLAGDCRAELMAMHCTRSACQVKQCIIV